MAIQQHLPSRSCCGSAACLVGIPTQDKTLNCRKTSKQYCTARSVSTRLVMCVVSETGCGIVQRAHERITKVTPCSYIVCRFGIGPQRSLPKHGCKRGLGKMWALAPQPQSSLCPILDAQLMHCTDSLALAPDNWLCRQLLSVFCRTVRDLVDELVAHKRV